MTLEQRIKDLTEGLHSLLLLAYPNALTPAVVRTLERMSAEIDRLHNLKNKVKELNEMLKKGAA